MSAPDARSSAPESRSAPEGAAERSSGSSTRLVVLLLILLVVGLAAGWDYLIARPGYEQALAKVEPLLPGGDADDEEEAEVAGESPASPPFEVSTLEDVHAVLGLTPAVTESAGAYLVERYSWRRGIPWMTYDLWVIYDDDAGRTLRNATSKREEADLYYATARPPEAPATDPAIESPADPPADPAEAPTDEPSETPADASDDAAADAPAADAADAPADDS
jgi:hypothetical protein